MHDFDRQFSELYGRAYGVAFKVLGDRGDAEDIAQESLARANLRWSRIEDFAGPWIVRVAANLAIDRARRRARVTTIDAPTDTSDGHADERLDLQRALQNLPKRQREVVALRYLADLPEADVARALGCSVGTVKTHASRGLAALKTAMSDRDV